MEDSTEVRTDGNSLLKAVYLSRLRLTRLLLEGGAYINESNERGETPLMVACRTRHTDAQSVPKYKMVKYLLESGADPNIQDKSGKTALMHACLERAGVEVLALLLSSGADPSFEDHSGCSALVYAVNSDDKDALRVLLDACKAKGKEVIIITTDKLPSGRQMTKQYLNVPPPPDLEEHLHCSPASCMSPSEIQLCTPPHPSCNPPSESQFFGPKDSQSISPSSSIPTSPPGSPTREPSPIRASGVAKLLHLQRLHSEPWLKIPPSLLLQQSKASSLTEELQDITPEEELSFRVNGLPFPRRSMAGARHQSIDVKDSTGLLRSLEQGSETDKGRTVQKNMLGRKMSYDSNLQHSSSHQNLLREGCASEATPVDKDIPDCLRNLAVSSLCNVVRRRNIGMDHYSSDSQLPQFGTKQGEVGPTAAAEKRKLVSSRSANLSGSRESLEGLTQRRSAALLERRGSGALLLDHISQTRPGYLPPLNPHAPIPDIKVNPAATSSALTNGSKPVCGSGAKHFVPFAPRDAKTKKTLLRRHSMQTEQIKQLVNFEEIFGQ
ncbi:ankyrin repeat domain 34Bb [Denticeps clupeoides]|uniref:Ankyrin repeat domain-containing protein 34B n=1 Tax=Denticeps clupeoides TaxID=299321 RepID=A0AAY4CNT3_9TELE|nr:ankyrin repeat domain-containing protein 34B [Denticeps clupeoides]XP_028852782.1 ankyrin repeat domain-containing protein 34B [Denticeps clupeoides]XP_028852783.1 ankyrin repeat domain-containing protein 34B [Denticeps clupeoides]